MCLSCHRQDANKSLASKHFNCSFKVVEAALFFANTLFNEKNFDLLFRTSYIQQTTSTESNNKTGIGLRKRKSKSGRETKKFIKKKVLLYSAVITDQMVGTLYSYLIIEFI